MIGGLGKSGRRRLAVLAGSLAVIGLLTTILHSMEWLDAEPDAPPDPAAETVIAGAAARIAAESEGAFASAEVVAAPMGQARANLDAAPAAHLPAPPSGYSFVEFHGQMSKAVLERRDSKGSELSDVGFEWLGTPTSLDVLAAQAAEAERDWSFGWIRLAHNARVGDLAQALQGTDAEIVGASGSLVRARLPGDKVRLQAILALPEVDGLGVAPASAKLQAVAKQASERQVHEPIPVFVTLMAGDPDGRWRRELEELGAVVGRFDPDIRVYAANATHAALQAMAAADFVMAIEPVGVIEAAHDTAVPAMGADALRMYLGSPGFYSGIGGAPVPIAVMDTGLNVNHLDISSNRSGICGANFVYFNPFVDEEDLWFDAYGHGTHVTGTIAGNGTVEPRYAGMAPLVRHIRFAKVLSHYGFGNDVSILRGMDFLAGSTACPESGWSTDPVKPLVVNMSLSKTARVWEGRGVSERKLDAIVWNHRQFYVVAQSNANIHGFSNYGSAKNSLAVGAARDSGSLAGFSSHGPTADGRLAPQVVGVGVGVRSPAGDGSRGGYRTLSGTSMSSPAVAGVAALLMEGVPAHREQPALVRARLMASAIKPDAWMADQSVFPTDNSNGPGSLQLQYGLGKVSARTSVLNRNQPDGWWSGSSVSRLNEGEYAYREIEVPQGASRLDLVLAWDEPPTDTLASAVLNDLDLWLDHGGDCEAEPCGEYASRSSVDNVEWIVVRNPAPGTYRAKVAATRVYTDPPRAALAWTVVRGASTPNLEITVDRTLVEVEDRNDERELTLSLKADAYVAAGTRVHIDCRGVDGSGCSRREFRLTAEREDGIAQEVDAWLGDDPIEVGELAVGETWKAKVVFENLAEGDADAFRLHFKASAWNANGDSTSVLTRTKGTDAAVPEAAMPANDLFRSALLIEGEEGAAELDLLGAVVEPGEPLLPTGGDRPAGSMWYEWTAPSDGKASFSVTPDAQSGSTHTVWVDVFSGERIAALEPVASAAWGAQFFAESGQVYRVRISHERGAAAAVLNWSSGSRPANDDFAAAAVLEDSDGSVEGSNEGATLEPGEFFGDLASTVWYQWTAPSDGAWQFASSAGDMRVLAFSGESLQDLRLVSGFARDWAVFPASRDAVYWIAVASRNAESAGQAYELTWSGLEREPGNDDFAGAEEIPGEASSRHGVGIDGDATVEPGEPVESGIRTKWWSWTAPSDGRYVWRLDELTRPTSGPDSRLMVSVFIGDELDALQLVATNGTQMAVEFAFDAVGGTRYWISAGMPAADQWAFTSWQWRYADVTLVWGPTPDNDEASAAATLAGTSGSVAGSNAFATGASGERIDVFGRSTLWWTYEAPASGWVRFAVDGDGGPWALTVHRESADGMGDLEVLGTSRWQRSDGEVLFKAREGVRYMIALGVRGGGPGGDFTLRWEEADDPGWLRYAGRLADGDRDSGGNPIEMRNPGNLAMRGDGTALYLASGIGLQVFERDPVTGSLDYAQLLETDFDLARAALLWDPHRNRLVVDNCREWRSFAPVGDGLELADLGDLPAVNDPSACYQSDYRFLFMDRDGSNLYRVGPDYQGLSHFAVDDGGGLRSVGEQQGVIAAVLSNAGEHLYAANRSELLVFTRNVETGEPSRTDFREAIDVTCCGRRPRLMTDDVHLYVFDQRGERTNLFSLEDPLNPKRLATLPQFWPTAFRGGNWETHCQFADLRSNAAVDVFCAGLAFTVRWDAEAGRLAGTDWISALQSDRFNGPPMPDFRAPEGLAVSPDDRHIYLSTPQHGILTFGRDSPPGEEGDAAGASINVSSATGS
ncbi:MAG: S8 family serine peptidase [Gammaproteobacteria bacterium]|nr:S8 family serine peptidase [Gammaproteobacteria bacterium]MYK82513.1 S8 family serine peptidase [Gammaproteobacteria bacterium]